MYPDIWVVGPPNQHFISGSENAAHFSKKKVFTGKTPLFVIDLFCTPHSSYLNVGFYHGSFA